MSSSIDSDKGDNIADRIEFIRNLLKEKRISPMIDLEDCNTEQVENSGRNMHSFLRKTFTDFHKMIYEIGGKLMYIKSGTTGHTFKGISYPDPSNPSQVINYAVKVVAYPKRENYGDLDDIRRPENAELAMLKLLSYFVINCHTPHLVLPIGTFNTNIKTFVNLAKYKIIENTKYDQFVKRFKQGEFHNEVSVLISEWANGGDLLDYIKNNYKTMTVKEWRVILFQILSTLAVIHEKYPGFRHNDLKANNILVQKLTPKGRDSFYSYYINDNGYLVPNTGVLIKVWDFDFACIPGIVENSKVTAEWTNKINVKPVMNRYYDVHYFFNTLTKKGFFPQLFDAPEVDPKVKQFVRRMVPLELATGDEVTDRGRILTDREFTTPADVIANDEFFHRFRAAYECAAKMNALGSKPKSS